MKADDREPRPSELLVFIEYDGSAYELTEDDKAYVDTEFTGGDSGAPYIKCEYGSRNGWGLLNGYLPRTQVPEDVPIRPAAERPPPEARQQAVDAALGEIMKKRELG
jgi:hypothetical protein